MTLAAGSISDLPVSAQVVATTTKKPPRNRQLIAKPDDVAAPEADKSQTVSAPERT